MQSRKEPSIGVVLLDLGGVRTRSEVRGFIARMLSDPEILSVPTPVRIPLAQVIAFKRAPAVARRYAEIGFSPIHAETSAIVEALAEQLGPTFRVDFAFRHSPPFPQEVLHRLAESGCRRLIALPLFAQRSRATSGTCLTGLAKAADRCGLDWCEARLEPDDAGLVAAFIDHATPMLESCEHVLFTAHGLPLRNVRRGDSYPDEISRTAEALRARLPETLPTSVAFQSRVGPVEWLEPHLDATIVALGHEGVRRLTVVPLSFLTENLETRHELDIEAAELARQAGIEVFQRVPVPGRHSALIASMARCVRAAGSQAGWFESGATI